MSRDSTGKGMGRGMGMGMGMGMGTGTGMDVGTEGKEAGGARYHYQAPGATKVYDVDVGVGAWGTAVPAVTACSSSSS